MPQARAQTRTVAEAEQREGLPPTARTVPRLSERVAQAMVELAAAPRLVLPVQQAPAAVVLVLLMAVVQGAQARPGRNTPRP